MCGVYLLVNRAFGSSTLTPKDLVPIKLYSYCVTIELNSLKQNEARGGWISMINFSAGMESQDWINYVLSVREKAGP